MSRASAVQERRVEAEALLRDIGARKRGRKGRALLRSTLALVGGAGLLLTGLWLWPFLGYALAPAGLWLAAVLGLLWRYPHLLARRAHQALGLLLLATASAGALELSVPSFGGFLGELLVGSSATIGTAQLAGIVVLGVVMLAPRPAWRLAALAARGARSLAAHAGRGAWYVASRGARLGGRGLALLVMLLVRAAAGAGRLAWVATRAGVRGVAATARAYSRHPLHRAAARGLWAVVTLPARVRIPLPRPPRREPLTREPAAAAAPLPVLMPPRTAAGQRTIATPSGFIVQAPVARPDPVPQRPDPLSPQIVDLRDGGAQTGRLGGGAKGWTTPPISLLSPGERRWVSREENEGTAREIERTLREFGIEVSVAEIRPGPVVTQYGLVPGWVRRYRDVKGQNPDGTPIRDDRGRTVTSRVEQKTRVKVDHILAREKDLALALAAPSLRFEAPVPGESFVGLEVPNAQPAIVSLRSLLESEAFRAFQRKGRLPVVLGQGSGGESVMTDLAAMPHLLIAGATGSGKSVCINTIVCSLVMQLTPLELQMYMVDPKRVELTPFNGLPHLAKPVVVETDDAVPTLRALIAEMQSRYKRFEALGVRNIETFNAKAKGPLERIPYLVLVIDELADLMMAAPADVEQSLCRLAQLGRATGIHLVVATQRPSVDVLTGLIKANIPSRISFAVASQVDSRTILDGVGAEKLLGRGDMLFLPADAPKPKRLQGAFISDDEVNALVVHWRGQQGARTVAPTAPATPPATPHSEPEDGDLREASDLAKRHSRISASLLQRKLGVGYAKAASLLDHLEDMGIVEPGDPGKSRAVIAQ